MLLKNLQVTQSSCFIWHARYTRFQKLFALFARALNNAKQMRMRREELYTELYAVGTTKLSIKFTLQVFTSAGNTCHEQVLLRHLFSRAAQGANLVLWRIWGYLYDRYKRTKTSSEFRGDTIKRLDTQLDVLV